MNEHTHPAGVEPQPARSLPANGTAIAIAGLAAAAVATARPALAAVPRAINPPLTFASIPGTGDIKVLNYALSLEAFETEVYVQALLRLTGGGKTPLGTNVEGLNSNNERLLRFTREFAMVERNHRDFLIAALGNNAITKSALRHFQVDVGINSRTEREVVELLYDVEATGVAAYIGAIPFFATKTYVPVAGGILGTEARHTAIFADLVNDLFDPRVNVAPTAAQNNGRDPYPGENGGGAIPNTPPGTPPIPDNVLAKVSAFLVLLP